MTLTARWRKTKVWTPDKIKALRKRLDNMTQQQLADALEVSIERIQNWEQGRQSPKGPAKILLNMLETRPEILLDLAHAG